VLRIRRRASAAFAWRRGRRGLLEVVHCRLKSSRDGASKRRCATIVVAHHRRACFLQGLFLGVDRLTGFGQRAARQLAKGGIIKTGTGLSEQGVGFGQHAFGIAAGLGAVLDGRFRRDLRARSAVDGKAERQAIVSKKYGVLRLFESGGRGRKFRRGVLFSAGSASCIDGPLRLIHFLAWGCGTAGEDSDERQDRRQAKPTKHLPVSIERRQ
jgi:hypothetical protein